MNLTPQISDDMHPSGKQPPQQSNLGIRFQRMADEHGQQTAIWFDEHDQVSYDELNRKSNRMARWLVDQGVVAKDVVCLSGEKSVDTFACMIACLKLGAVYCVLDYDSPAARLSKILAICQPRLLLAGRDLLDKLDETISNLGVGVIEKNSDRLAKTFGNPGDANLPQTLTVTGNDPAYIMFTSGSTGFPKGAVMTHANVLNLIEWSKDTFDIGSDEIVTSVNPMFFDNSVFDFYSALFNGACLVPFSKLEVGDPKRLVHKLDTAR